MRIHRPPESGELLLWRSVIVRAIHDVLTTKHESKKTKETALSWFVDKPEYSSFEMVCDLANIDPQCVRRYLLSQLTQIDVLNNAQNETSINCSGKIEKQYK